ncbi:tol-pal system YbgF family protein [Flavobacterium sp. J27]|uniref:tetratricopeptide repeat protein n=1 Tax=Flavobacterium sp. J27 TaxID=2060419 RepID=UPI0010301882|nr:tetratricopeptide repeat protein [Flavobacterium sp. J27]
MKEDVFLLFDQYLENEMTPQEKLDFENQLQNSIELNEAFELYKETSHFLKNTFSTDVEDFKNNLKAISKRSQEEEEVIKSRKVISMPTKWFAIAASIVVLFFVWFFMNDTVPEYQDFNQHEKAYFTERSQNNIYLKQAEEAFNAKNYQKAVLLFENITSKDLGVEEQLFYAIALLEENQFPKAESILENIKRQPSVFRNKAIWYLALSKLKQKDYENCKTLLNEIPKQAEDYDKAQKLLDKL